MFNFLNGVIWAIDHMVKVLINLDETMEMLTKEDISIEDIKHIRDNMFYTMEYFIDIPNILSTNIGDNHIFNDKINKLKFKFINIIAKTNVEYKLTPIQTAEIFSDVKELKDIIISDIMDWNKNSAFNTINYITMINNEMKKVIKEEE